MCVYNLSAASVMVDLPAEISPVLAQAAEIDGRALSLGANGFVIGRTAS